MPKIYRKGEYDLAGCIVGVVDRAKIIDGRKIRPGDVILGLPSNGLHTNGYSLARKILFEKMRLKVSSRLPGSKTTVGQELLRVHKNYQALLAKVPGGTIKGLAHITGGGLIDNLPRILPTNCDAVIETKTWKHSGDLPNFAAKWKRRSGGDVSGFQYGHWDGCDCGTARRCQGNGNAARKTDWPNRARDRQNALVLLR